MVEPSIHPSGRRYEWEASSSPLEGAVPSPLPECLRRLWGNRPERNAPTAAELLDRAELARVRSALCALDPRDADDRETWLRYGMALHSTGWGEHAYREWLAWAQQSPKFDEADSRRVWASFRASGVTLGTLFDAAKRRGWEKPNRKGAALPAEPMQPARVLRDAADLMAQPMAPVRYVVPGWLPEGLTLVVAAPKLGKSTLVLQMERALASGGKFWGEDVPAAHVLMIDLETNERRLRRKLEQAGTEPIPPGTMKFAFEWPKGLLGIEEIARALDADPEIRLVVIDTLQRFRDSTGSKNVYASDYEALGPLQQLCKDRPGLAIICVHHKRKGATDDPIDSINGSAALAGAADGIWILNRRGAEFVLHVQARDWERDEDEFVLVRDGGRWELSNAPRYSYSETEILSVLDKVGPMATAAVAEELSVSRQAALKRLQRMQELGHVQFHESAWRSLR